MSAPFGARTTYRVGGSARRVVVVDSGDALEALVSSLEPDDQIYILGRGSNTLVSDAGFDGVVVHLDGSFCEIEVDVERAQIWAGGGADLPVVARRSVEAGLEGFEWAVGVPGSLGGAVAMNAGGHGAEMSACLLEVELCELGTGQREMVAAADLELGYRHSSIGPRQLVLGARLQLAHGDAEVGRERLKEIVRWRREHQPGGANCGSVFTNPAGESAGQLVEAAGCRGMRLGSAEVSPKHANFIQADSGGSGDDVRALIELVADRVEQRSGLRLRTEVRMVGFGDEGG